MAGKSDYIKFDPEKIMEVSMNFDRLHNRFTVCTGNIKKKAESMRSIWQGDSAVLYAEKLKELDTQSAEIAKKFLSYSQDLAKASGIYKDDGETVVKRIAEGLPTDGVFLS